MRSKDKIDLIVKIDRLNWKFFNIGVTNFNIFPIIGAPYELFKSFPLFICEFYNSSCRLPIPHKIGYLFLMPDFGPSWPMIKVDSLSKFQVSQHKAHTHSLSLSLSLSLQWRRHSPPSSTTVDAASVSGFSLERSPKLPFPDASTTMHDGHSEKPFLSLSLSPEASPKPNFRRAQASATSSLKLLSPPPKPSPSE